ncbi:adenylate kinase family enzyme [Bacillus tianshenii]|uniref:Adenylate kinase family enzyme n=2 Tax=Sutcliffiella tianshenii TaxID=1463404 RepID=A0ABS2P4Z1_9BACI|nr:topology modulation protein [Bacillus tianshenii]MBM7622008.1 adenylate kinase family enzyme [Bacillus tianshenii]
MVIGVSAGAGKSTFARRLGKALEIEVHHLDRLYWKPNWVEASKEEFAQAQQDIIKHKQGWIIEGNYTGTFDLRAKHADTMIYLEIPLYTCLYRVIKRWLINLGKTRPDMGEGCEEKMEWSFIKFIYTTYHARKRKMRERFRQYGNGRTIIVLRNQKEIEAYISRIENQKRKIAN